MKQLLVFILILGLWGCKSAKKAAELTNPQPTWVLEKPINRLYYIGIGSARKWGSPANYESEAREKALSDMAAQISSNISSTAILHQVENKDGVSEMLASQIKVSSKEYLEGYELIDQWQDESTYYVYYQLSKQQFSELKEQRRNKAVEVAQARYLEAQTQDSANQTINAITTYASALESLKEYLGDNNIKETPTGTVDIAIESIKAIKQNINSLKIKATNATLKAKATQMIPESQLTFSVSLNGTHPQANIPVQFVYSAGFLRTDNVATNSQGLAATTIYQVSGSQPTQSLCAKVDVTKLARMMSQDLLIRKLIEDTAGNTDCITISLE